MLRLQPVGFTEIVVTNVGAVGAETTIGESIAGQVAFAFLTTISYVPAATPTKLFEAWKITPPSIEYDNGAIPPFAVITIEPLGDAQVIEFVIDTAAIFAPDVCGTFTVEPDAVAQVAFAFLT